MSERNILPITLGAPATSGLGQDSTGLPPAGVFNIIVPRRVLNPAKGTSPALKTHPHTEPETSLHQAEQPPHPRRSSRRTKQAERALRNPLPARSVGILYVGRTEGEMTTVLGKVGISQDSLSVIKRAEGFKASDRIFDFVLEAAFEVTLPAGTVMKRVEDAVHNELAHGGLKRFGENFVAPGGHMPFLANLTAQALTRLGHTFVALDIQEPRQAAIQRNSETWVRLRNRPVDAARDIYQEWLQDHNSPPSSVAGLQRRSQYLRAVLALGYLVRDLASGGPFHQLELPLRDKVTLTVHPSSLKAAQFEYQAEVALNLPSADHFSARVSAGDELPLSPLALSVILEDTMEFIDIPNTFLPQDRPQSDLVRFSPEHLAALGLLGGRYGEACLWEGLGVRARVPLQLHRTIQAHPDLLPAIRFWVGLKHFMRLHFRLEDFILPNRAEALWSDRLLQSAQVLEEAGYPVPESVRDYVEHAWIPGNRGRFKTQEKWVV